MKFLPESNKWYTLSMMKIISCFSIFLLGTLLAFPVFAEDDGRGGSYNLSDSARSSARSAATSLYSSATKNNGYRSRGNEIQPFGSGQKKRSDSSSAFSLTPEQINERRAQIARQGQDRLSQSQYEYEQRVAARNQNLYGVPGLQNLGQNAQGLVNDGTQGVFGPEAKKKKRKIVAYNKKAANTLSKPGKVFNSVR